MRSRCRPTWTNGASITRRPAWTFGHTAAVESLTKHFGTHSLEGFGFDAEADAADSAALRAAGAVLDYLAETQKASLAHIDRLLPYSAERTAGDRPGHAPQPGARRRRSATAAARARCLGVIDRTVTSLGARLLADWLAAPLTDVAAINARLDAVAELVADADAHRAAPRIARADLRHPAAAWPA